MLAPTIRPSISQEKLHWLELSFSSLLQCHEGGWYALNFEVDLYLMRVQLALSEPQSCHCRSICGLKLTGSQI